MLVKSKIGELPLKLILPSFIYDNFLFSIYLRISVSTYQFMSALQNNLYRFDDNNIVHPKKYTEKHFEHWKQQHSSSLHKLWDLFCDDIQNNLNIAKNCDYDDFIDFVYINSSGF